MGRERVRKRGVGGQIDIKSDANRFTHMQTPYIQKNTQTNRQTDRHATVYV